MSFNRFVEWTRNGETHSRHSSLLSAPLWPIHGRRYVFRPAFDMEPS
jgi:hypothetical protein